MAEFEWNEAKRALVLRSRQLDFYDCEALFDGRSLLTLRSPRGTEERWVSIGELRRRLIAVVWTKREGNIRIITMRRARDEEERQYRQLYE